MTTQYCPSCGAFLAEVIQYDVVTQPVERMCFACNLNRKRKNF